MELGRRSHYVYALKIVTLPTVGHKNYMFTCVRHPHANSIPAYGLYLEACKFGVRYLTCTILVMNYPYKLKDTYLHK